MSVSNNVKKCIFLRIVYRAIFVPTRFGLLKLTHRIISLVLSKKLLQNFEIKSFFLYANFNIRVRMFIFEITHTPIMIDHVVKDIFNQCNVSKIIYFIM